MSGMKDLSPPLPPQEWVQYLLMAFLLTKPLTYKVHLTFYRLHVYVEALSEMYISVWLYLWPFCCTQLSARTKSLILVFSDEIQPSEKSKSYQSKTTGSLCDGLTHGSQKLCREAAGLSWILTLETLRLCSPQNHPAGRTSELEANRKQSQKTSTKKPYPSSQSAAEPRGPHGWWQPHPKWALLYL